MCVWEGERNGRTERLFLAASLRYTTTNRLCPCCARNREEPFHFFSKNTWPLSFLFCSFPFFYICARTRWFVCGRSHPPILFPPSPTITTASSDSFFCYCIHRCTRIHTCIFTGIFIYLFTKPNGSYIIANRQWLVPSLSFLFLTCGFYFKLLQLLFWFLSLGNHQVDLFSAIQH